MTCAIVLMGVSGCGKTTVGMSLARILGWPLYDGDDFHPEANITKMSQGIPLNDDDRHRWLANLHNLISDHIDADLSMLLACSALKQKYRDQLTMEKSGVVFIYLRGDYDLIQRRIQARERHYMKASMLKSQFEALEEPIDAVVVNIDQSLDSIVKQILRELNLDDT